MNNDERNLAAAEAFASAFEPPLSYTKTERINNVPERHAYAASGMLADGQVGVTAVIWGNGHLKAYLEFVGARDMAGEVGEKFAQLAHIWENGDVQNPA